MLNIICDLVAIAGFVLSITLPINLPALGAESGFLAFLVPQGTLSKHDKDLIFRICTNRGKAVQMTFSRYEDKIVH